MSRIQKAFENKKAFIAFLTAGDPSLDKTEEYILEMERAGADLIEIGIPFSDPIAEGPVIQEADIRALSGGVTTDDIFDMVKKLREKTEIPPRSPVQYPLLLRRQTSLCRRLHLPVWKE